MSLRQFRLLLATRRPNHRCAPSLRDLSKDEPKPACDGVNEDRLARGDFVRFGCEGKCGKALDRESGGGAEGDRGRESENFPPGDRDVFREGTGV
jgi:hypothetical protein